VGEVKFESPTDNSRNILEQDGFNVDSPLLGSRFELSMRAEGGSCQFHSAMLDRLPIEPWSNSQSLESRLRDLLDR